MTEWISPSFYPAMAINAFWISGMDASSVLMIPTNACLFIYCWGSGWIGFNERSNDSEFDTKTLELHPTLAQLSHTH